MTISNKKLSQIKIPKQDLIGIISIVGVVFLFFLRLFWPTSQIIFIPELERSDILHQNLPFKALLQDAFSNGTLPLWTNTVGNGFPVLAEGQVGSFYPPNIIFGLLPLVTAWNLNYLVAFWISGLGFYVLLRSQKQPVLVSSVMATVYSLSGFFITHLIHINMLHTVAWLPWIVWQVSTYLRAPTPPKAIVIGTLLSLQFLAGYPQYQFISLVLVSLFIVFQIIFENLKLQIKHLQLSPLIVLVWLGLSAIQLVPTWELLNQASLDSRISYEYITHFQYSVADIQGIIWPYFQGKPQDGSYFNPDLQINSLFWENVVFIGWLPLLFGIWGWFKDHKRRNSYLLMFGIAFTGILLALAVHGPLFWVFYLPGFNMFRVTSRYLLLTTFGLTLLGSYGFSYWYKSHHNQVHRLLVVLGILLPVVVFAHQQMLTAPTERITSLEQVSSVVPKENRVISEQSRTVAWMKEYLNNGWADPNHYLWLSNTLAPSVNILSDHRQLQVYAGMTLARADAFNHSAGSASIRMADFVTTADPNISIPEATLAALLHPPQPYYPTISVFTVNQPADRYYLTATYLPAENFTAAEKLLQESDDFISQPIIETNEEISQDTTISASVKVTSETATSVDLRVVTNQPTWLIRQASYYPGWVATVDDNLTQIYPANLAFQAIMVPEGEHTIVFKYIPKTLYYGATITIITLLSIGIYIANHRSSFRPIKKR